MQAEPLLASRAANPLRLDQSLWNHLDEQARSLVLGDRPAALLSFSLGPVQPFIEAAHTVRDLWTGSYLLSHLTFSALKPILDKLGPAAVLFPALRGMPPMDLYLIKDKKVQGLDRPDKDRRVLPCLPNRFVALVLLEEAADLSEACEQGCQNAWKEICNCVLATIEKEIIPKIESNPEAKPGLVMGWSKLWEKQVHIF